MMTLFQNYGDGGGGGGGGGGDDDENHNDALSNISYTCTCTVFSNFKWFAVFIDGFTVFFKN